MVTPPKSKLPSHNWAAAAIFAVAFALMGGISGGILLLVGLAAHEAAHAFLAWIHGVRVYSAGVCFKGPFILRDRAKENLAEVTIALAGPAASFVFGVLLFVFPQTGFHWAGACNLLIAVTNLLPLPGSDGLRAGRALWAEVRERSAREAVPARATVLRLTADL